jgi:hypothetical protein
LGSLFASGRIVDVIIAFMALELIVLILVRKQLLPRARPAELIANIGAGAALLWALRAALVGWPWPRIALCLLIALGFHVGELMLRRSMPRTR